MPLRLEDGAVAAQPGAEPHEPQVEDGNGQRHGGDGEGPPRGRDGEGGAIVAEEDGAEDGLRSSVMALLPAAQGTMAVWHRRDWMDRRK